MMGFQGTPARLFYDFCLEEHVPVDHMLRGIDRHLALDDLRQSLKPFYSQMGRPSVDPELMIRMLIVGYCMGIRSERRLCEEVHLNLAYRWFCRLGLDGRVPDHSTFSKNRHGRFRESDMLSPSVRERGAALHRRGAGQRRWICGRRQPDCGRRQQATLGSKPRMEARGDQGKRRPRRARISCDSRRCGFWRGIPCDAEIHLAIRPGGPMDRRTQGTCLLRLCQQLSDRHRPWGDCRCRSHARHSPGGSRSGAHNARADRDALRHEARIL